MTVLQELRSLNEFLILAHIELCSIEEEVKALEPKEKGEKLLKRIEQLREQIESCI